MTLRCRNVADLGMTFGMRRSERGDTFFNCLVVMVLVMGAVMWAWMKFGAHRGILQAGKPESIVTDRSGNREATLRYQQRMRERYFGSSEFAVSRAADFVGATVNGKFAKDRAAFEQRSNEVMRGLEDNVSELNANQVPLRFVDDHLRLGSAHNHAYQAVELCGLTLSEEPELQKQHYREAKELVAKATREVRLARQRMESLVQ